MLKIAYRPAAPAQAALGCLVWFFTEKKVTPPRAAPAPWREAVARAVRLKDFNGKKGELLTLQMSSGRADRLLLVGLGEAGKLEREGLRRAAGSAGKALAGMPIAKAGVWLPAGLPAAVAKTAPEVLAEGLLLGSYRFKPYKSADSGNGKGKSARPELSELTLYDPDKAGTAAAVTRGIARGEAVCLARDLGNHPGNVMTPTRLGQEAQKIAKKRGLRCTVMDRARMERLGMGMLLGVTQGSRQPPRLIVMEYRAPRAKQTLAFVGKGITFDSGGISLKPGAAMDEMKFDMCGAAAVLGAMDAIGRLRPNVNVVGIVPAAENLPGGEATKPGDILKAFSGKHVEILNTDAEGRLVLGDALAYGIKQYKPDGVVDLATLTGACVVALGHYATGAVSNNEGFQAKVVAAGRAAGDIVWPLPNFPEYEEGLKGKYADLQNIAGRDGGAITGGLFLKNFVGDTPWVHLDIAGTAWGVKGVGHVPYDGATGVGVCLLVDLAANWK